MISKFLKLIKDPLYLPWCLLHKLSPYIKNDIIYLKWDYLLSVKHKLDLDNPKSFNAKLQWLKLYLKDTDYSKFVDKVKAKEYVDTVIGPGHTIPTLGIWDNFDDIDFDKLPNEFVLKCTHDSGTIVICKDKTKLNIKKARKIITKGLQRKFYLEHREYVYKDVKPRIIAEKLMVDESGSDLKDYKFFCFNGIPKMLFTVKGRPHPKLDFLDLNYNILPFERGYPVSGSKPYKPFSFDRMIELSRLLSKDFPFVRIDWYDINGIPYFGEFTFFPGAGCEPFKPDKWDYIVGEWLKLPE